MTSIPPPVWPARVVAVDLGYPGFTRDRPDEFRHRGLLLERVPTGVAALVALGRDAEPAAVVVPVELPDFALPDFLDVVRAVSGIPVVVARDPRLDQDIPESVAEHEATIVSIPVTPSKLVALIGGLAPHEAPAPTVYRCGALELDADRFRVLWHGRDVRMTPREFDLLRYLMAAHPRVVTMAELISECVPKGIDWQASSIRTSIRRIRLSMEDAVPGAPVPLVTITKIGYRLVEGSAATAGTRSSATSRSTREKTSSLTRRTTSLGLPAGSASGQSM